MSLSLLRRCELAQPQPYDGKGEVLWAIVATWLWFGAIILRLQLATPPWTFPEQLVEATSFVVFAAIPIFVLASRPGAQIAQWLLHNHGFRFQALTCCLVAGYILLLQGLGLHSDRFLLLDQLRNLIFKQQFWLNTVIYLSAIFVVLRIPFLFLNLPAFRGILPSNRSQTQPKSQPNFKLELLTLLGLNCLYISLVNTSAFTEGFNFSRSNYWVGLLYGLIYWLANTGPGRKRGDRLRLLDLLLVTACLLSLFWFSLPRLNFGVFLSIDLLVLVMFYGLGLPREHFGYSFQVRSRDLLYTGYAIALAFLLLVPIALLSKFGSSTISPSWTTLPLWSQVAYCLSYAILFSFRVGVFEETVFRSGLMVIIRDSLQTASGDRVSGKRLVLSAAMIGSLIFGLCHIGNDPSPTSSLSPVEYKAVYAGLATAASLFYALAFGETNRLWSSIVIHGIVDTTAVLALGSALTVPF
jgi:membrane protease YdiL (CAAX protease family)